VSTTARKTAAAIPDPLPLWLPPVLLTAFYAAGAAYFDVTHNFPIGDSWAYQRSLELLAEHGRLRLSEFSESSLVGQLLLAAPFCLLLSAKPVVVNGVVYAMSLSSVLLLYAAQRRMRFRRGPALLGALTLAANPIMLAQSVAFDTEVPFVFVSCAGLLALAQWDRTRRPLFA